ncbi:hypothetical protein GOBAR_DD13844 [Gossypium barbadense]|nr:hypothetical protein GOBAR_DD13844 [Gossypium barbadense]
MEETSMETRMSWKDTLMANLHLNDEQWTLSSDDEFSVLDNDDIEVLDSDVHVSYDGPYLEISFSKRVHDLFDKSMANVVIIKPLGRSIGYRTLDGRLKSLWNLQGDFKLVDLDNDYFIVKLNSPKSYKRVLMEGSWMIFDHYIMVQP